MGFLSNLFGIDDAKAAASNAANQNRQTANAAYGTAQNIQSPFYTQGVQANNTLGNFLGLNGVGTQQNAYDSYVAGPDVTARMNQGIRAIDNSYAGRNAGTLSGGLLKSLTKYGTDVATQDYGNYLQRLMAQSNQGQNAANQLTNANYQSAGMTSNANTAEGNAIANASLAGGNILGNILGGAFGLAGSQGWNPFGGGNSGGGMAYGVRSNDPWAGIR
jgi:hypothetical protein